MHSKIKIILILILSLFIFPADSFAQKSQSKDRQPTKIAKYVVDETGTLKQDEINYLMQKLINFEKETSNQLIVYMIPSLNGESIEEVAIELAEENKIGQQGKDNGVLLLIAMNDKKMRIEVGYGLEGALPDATALSIINNEIKPEFKQNNFFKGIDRGVDAIIAATKGEYTAKESDDDGSGIGLCGLPIFIIIAFFVIFIMIVFSIIQRLFGCGKGWTSGGAHSGTSGWWSSGSGSSSSSSGSSFGSFSGGGGSFGGGGASGGW